MFYILIKDKNWETVITRVISQGYYLMHQEKKIPHKMPQPFQQKVDYEGDTDENNSNTNESQSD